MHGRIRFALPLSQIAIAVGLTAADFLGHGISSRLAWIAPFRQLFIGLNAPAAEIEIYLKRLAWIWSPSYYPAIFILDTFVYFLLVGLVWYAVAIEITGRGYSMLTSKLRPRRAADLLASAFGLILV